VGPFYNGDISQMKCSTPMESWTFKSHTQFHHLTNRTKRSNVYDPFSNGLYLTVLDNPRLSITGSYLKSSWKFGSSSRIFGILIIRCPDFFLSRNYRVSWKNFRVSRFPEKSPDSRNNLALSETAFVRVVTPRIYSLN